MRLLCDAPECTTPAADVQKVSITLPEGRWSYDMCAEHRGYLYEWVTDMQRKPERLHVRPVLKPTDIVVQKRKKRGATRR